MSESLAPKLRLLKTHLLSTVVLLVGLTYSTTLKAQTTTSTSTADRWETAAGGKMAFDVASVKQDKLSARPVSNVKLNNARTAYPPNGGVFSARNYTLLDYMAFAYKLSEQQEYILLPGLPDWVYNDRFDIEGKSENHSPTKDQMRLMLQALLEDRFKLALHMETRQLPVLGLVPAKPGKTGPQLKQHSADSPCPATDSASSVASAPVETILRTWPPNCRHTRDIRIPGGSRLAGRDVSMGELADALNGEGEGRGSRIIVDQTGLKGTFDFVMDFAEESEHSADEDVTKTRQEVPLPTFLGAITDQLGLKLVKKTAPIDCFVIAHVEHPSAN
ncbi:MAG TPA: TIGR03435 family protein [Granulicella sp.]|jgi:uncharacterized protein (TIGR03435 family)